MQRRHAVITPYQLSTCRRPGCSAQLLLGACYVGTLVLVLSAGQGLDAHPVLRGVGSAVLIEFLDDRLKLVIDIGFGEDAARQEMELADTDLDGEVDAAEAQAYVEYSWANRALDRLVLKLNKRLVTLKPTKMWEEQLKGGVTDLPFNVYFECEVELVYATPEDREKRVRLDMRNRILKHPDLKERALTQPFWILPVIGHSEEVSYVCSEPQFIESLVNAIGKGPKILVDFDYSGGEGPEDRARLLTGTAIGADADVERDKGTSADLPNENDPENDPENDESESTIPSAEVVAEPFSGNDPSLLAAAPGGRVTRAPPTETLPLQLSFAALALILGLSGALLTFSGSSSECVSRCVGAFTLRQGMAIILIGMPVVFFMRNGFGDGSGALGHVLAQLLGSAVLLFIGVLTLASPRVDDTADTETRSTSRLSSILPSPTGLAVVAFALWHVGDVIFAGNVLAGYLVGTALGATWMRRGAVPGPFLPRLLALIMIGTGLACLVFSVRNGRHEIAAVLETLSQSLRGA
jgi:hypothetical protein